MSDDEIHAMEIRFARLAAEHLATSLQFYLESPPATKEFMREVIEGTSRFPPAVRGAAIRLLVEMSVAKAEDFLRKGQP